jgi:hypothetical protein
MRITTYAVSRVGSRANQDDALGDADLVAGRCAVVADGAGGHRGGAIASKVATEAILLNLASARRWSAERLEEAIAAASRSVKKQQETHSQMSEMSSTVVVLCLESDGRKAFWTHVATAAYFTSAGAWARSSRRITACCKASRTPGVVLPGSAKPDRSVLYAAIGAEGDLKLVVGSNDRSARRRRLPHVHRRRVGHRLAHGDGAAPAGSDDRRGMGARGHRRVEQMHRESQDNYTTLGVWLGSPEQTTITRI